MKPQNYGVRREPPAILGAVPRKYPWLSDDKHCDVCVVGGGLTGAMCAMESAEAGLSTVLITSGGVGFGMTGHASGGAEYDCGSTLAALDRSMPVNDALRLYSMGFEALDDLQNLCGRLDGEHRASGLKSGFERRDSLIMTPDPTMTELMEAESVARRRKFADCTFITRKTAASAFPFDMCAGLLTREGGAVLDPYALAHMCLISARNAGAEIFEMTAATDIQTPKNRNGCVIITTSTHRTVYADRLIFASGSEGIDSLTGRTGERRFFTVIVRPHPQSSMWTGKCLLRTFGRHSVSCLIRPDGCIAANTSAKNRRNPLLHRFTNADGSDGIYGKLSSSIGKAIADGEKTKNLFEYSFEITSVPDGLPVIGRHNGFNNCVFALSSPSSLFGDTCAPVFARIAAKNAAKLIGSDTSENDPLFDPMRL